VGLLQILGIIALALWILITLGIVAVLVRALPALRRFDGVVGRVNTLLEATEGRLTPILDHLEDVTDDIQFVTASVRTDVQSVGRLMERATDTAEDILDMAEERAAEINGLLEVVQEEAEETFLSTASVLRALRGSGRKRSSRRSGRRSA